MSKYNVGDKFIIEIEEIYNGNLIKYEDHMHLHRVKGFNSLVLDEYGLDKLQKHDALQERLELIDELKQAEYNKGLNDAWEFMKKWDSMNYETSNEMFSSTTLRSILNRTPQEALAKLKAYEEQSKIEVGDILLIYGEEAVVTRVVDEHANILFGDGVTNNMPVKELAGDKTGKHIDIKSFLEQIRGE